MIHLDLVKILDSVIQSADQKLSPDEMAKLISIREHLARSKSLEERIKWGAELLKYMVMFHELFK